MQWHIQAVSITINLKFKIYLTLPELSVTKVVTWNRHVYDSAKGVYYMILGIYLLTAIGSNLNYLTKSLKNMINILNGIWHSWLIWVNMKLNI